MTFYLKFISIDKINCVTFFLEFFSFYIINYYFLL